MGFLLTSRSMTLDDLELLWNVFSRLRNTDSEMSSRCV